MKRRLKKILKGILIVIESIIGLMLLYFLLNLNLFHKTKPLSNSEIQAYISRIDSSSPLQYVAEKFDTHSIVFLGEMHKRKQDLDFFKDLIPYLYQTKGIKTIGWEFGAANYQKDADSIVTAPEFDRSKAITLMRNTKYFWCYEDYLNVFKTIWQLNRTIPQDSDKVRFLQLNGPYIPKRWTSNVDSVRLKERQNSIDVVLPKIVEKEVISKNKKILIYCGLHHSLTKFRTPKFFFLKDDGRAGQKLYKKYPDKVFQICLLSSFPTRWLIYKGIINSKDLPYDVFPFDGIFNQLYDTLKIPFAIDTSDPSFSNVKDYNSFYAFDKFNGIKLKDFCDGAIMLASFDKIEPVDVITDWVTNEKELDEVKNILPNEDAKHIKTIQDLMGYINPNANQEDIRKFHSIKKFW